LPVIEITLDVDFDCTVRVSAKDLGTGKKQEMVLDAEAARAIVEPDPQAQLAEFDKNDRPRNVTSIIHEMASSNPNTF
jgi:hypothetical protein